ncbi:MAG: hypothetical protein A2Y86_02865 [Candidatus Aminicenantes bacterium RBG_13_62_12]|nr:MAG: hypothetical protein A2Y86_02865 [Candidatus Aminicenantes bacterium RBG_13_62_12]
MSLWKSFKNTFAKASAGAQETSKAAPPQPPKADAAGADTIEWYVVQKGDTLSHLAKRYYGKAGQYMKIFNANQDILKDPNLIKVGQKLRIPK